MWTATGPLPPQWRGIDNKCRPVAGHKCRLNWKWCHQRIRQLSAWWSWIPQVVPDSTCMATSISGIWCICFGRRVSCDLFSQIGNGIVLGLSDLFSLASWHGVGSMWSSLSSATSGIRLRLLLASHSLVKCSPLHIFVQHGVDFGRRALCMAMVMARPEL